MTSFGTHVQKPRLICQPNVCGALGFIFDAASLRDLAVLRRNGDVGRECRTFGWQIYSGPGQATSSERVVRRHSSESGLTRFPARHSRSSSRRSSPGRSASRMFAGTWVPLLGTDHPAISESCAETATTRSRTKHSAGRSIWISLADLFGDLFGICLGSTWACERVQTHRTRARAK